MRLVTGIALIVAAAGTIWGNPAKAQRRCAPSEEAGWISSVQIVETGPTTARPHILSGRNRIPVSQGVELCAQERVINPPNSRRRVYLRFAGEAPRPLEPGREITVPPLPRFARLRESFNRLFGGGIFRQTGRGVDPAAPRGETCYFRPVEPPASALAVPEWGPLRVSWPCTSSFQGLWQVTLLKRGEPQAVMHETRNMIEVDVARCSPNCMLMVEELGSARPVYVLLINVVPAAQARLPREIAMLPPGAIRDALTGAHLSKRRDTAWHILGYSLLYRTACYVPAAATLANQAFGFAERDDPCRELDVQAGHQPR